jgi:hypothetical protein
MKFQLKPKDLTDWRYWVHLLILSAVVLGILQIWQGGNMFSISNVLLSVPLLAIGDIIAHTVMGID